jgi:hypothetical protein
LVFVKKLLSKLVLKSVGRYERNMDDLINKDMISNSDKTGLHLRSGTNLGKYSLKRRLGTGGACEVWEARDSVEGIWVALKIPLEDINGDRYNEALLR